MRVMSNDHHNHSGADLFGDQDEIATLSHNLMGSISALMMCEHMISRELSAYEVLHENSTLQTSLDLLKQTIGQIKETGDELMQASHRCIEGPSSTDSSEPSL